MNAFTNYLEKLGSNFVVSAMVPSLALVVASILMFDPILQIAAAFKDPQGTGQLVGFGLIVFIVTVVIGYTLTVLNTHVLKIFEGYIAPFPLKFIYNKVQRIYQHKAGELMARRERIKHEYQHLKRLPSKNPDVLERLEVLKDEYYAVASLYDREYPANLDDVLPTRFGNQLRAAEDHAVQRYGFDGVTFWPRLIHVIPDSYKSTIDEARNEVSFLANMSILSLAFSCLCFIAILHVMLTTAVVSGSQAVAGAAFGRVASYLVASVVGGMSCVFFYKASIISLSSFTLTIRSSFDLFRLDLLRKLEVPRPNNTREEFNTWQNLTELIVIGNESITFTPFEYRPENDPQK